MTNELAWIGEARSHIGLLENTSRTQHNPIILQWLEDVGKLEGVAKAWWSNDEVPWCGLFVAVCLGKNRRFVVREWYRARDWADDRMTKLARPAYGSIVVMSRQGGGHVGFVVGIDQFGNIMVLGGNQSNRVSIAPFSRERLAGATYWWPSIWRGGAVIKSQPLPDRYRLPLLTSDGKLSTNEA